MTSWSAREIEAWVKTPRKPVTERAHMVEMAHLLHPKITYLKSLPVEATVLDIGAGDGSLPTLARWPEPARHDYKTYAYSLEKGMHFDNYTGFELCNFDKKLPQFKGVTFDGAFCSHFIEHIADTGRFASWLSKRMGKNAHIYLEWPSEASAHTPTLLELKALGMPFTIGNFHDDGTHQKIPARDEVLAQFKACGFDEVARGIVTLPVIEDEVIAHDADKLLKDGVCTYEMQLAYWSKVGWAQYLVLRRVDEAKGL
ncbi:methyltransferase domain-containing protein [Maricaulis sp.]|uniref:methyltransferase domain-containing protein n=1 Tax=Maricaulis sp. TaxID=1486257 RepID=UPI003A92221C